MEKEETLDLEAQPLNPEGNGVQEQTDSELTFFAKIRQMFKNVSDIKISKYDVPFLIFSLWLLCFITYTSVLLQGTCMFYKESEYNTSLTSSMKKDIIAMESLMEDPTKKISSYFPDEWVHGTYKVDLFGICRQNDNSKEVCYKGNHIEDLILQDIGIQIAEQNGMENVESFGENFQVKYRALQENMESELKRRKTCKHGVCTFEGLSNEDITSLPNTERSIAWPYSLEIIMMVLSALTVIAILVNLSMNNDKLKIAIAVGVIVHLPVFVFTSIWKLALMDSFQVYFDNRNQVSHVLFSVIDIAIRPIFFVTAVMALDKKY
ncbi:uncharacterized protein CXQ87_001526 [Candidozyma duobushaemuli]|uniref:Uncharacterized protein n=2 Tax=Candidozyma TaxID=3303203 RepID=A0ABX8I8U1_9ASCO|nr:uncharacterized protein CXQ87_001526 [[Candida] duobushaemulonis]PVH18595.1 hypothetical protein CXQ87_001526 [[Candida] duobushaemulonis]QWU87116.1 hypothetical protein CA3LBN_001334 [[Candida] haemuloni]